MTHFFIQLVYHICLYLIEHEVLILFKQNRSKPLNRMVNLSKIGRIFYGISITEIGLQAIYYHDFPYILSFPKNFWIPGVAILAFIFGLMFTLAAACIVFEKKARQIFLLFGSV